MIEAAFRGNAEDHHADEGRLVINTFWVMTADAEPFVHKVLSFLFLIHGFWPNAGAKSPPLSGRQAQIRFPPLRCGPSVYGRPQGCKRFLPVGYGQAVEFFRVSGLLMQHSVLRALMVSSRNGSKTHLRGLSLREGHWFSYS